MMMLSKERLETLEQIWEDYPDGLELTMFTKYRPNLYSKVDH